VYLCNVAGTVNFGAGAITFAVGDQAIYSGTIWQKAGGSTGTVTSVAVTETGDALTITGSPITTSGTINIGFAGVSGQYVNGAGGLTTFPTLLSSVGLSMPSAFTVTNSPLTANGTIAVTGAGTTLQYVRGDGSLATLPTAAQEAKRLITEVYNSTGATLTKGTVVYINGGQGNLPTVTKALATSDATSAQTYGLVQTDITNMNNGFVVVIGSLTDLDTQAFAAGTQLYLSGVTAGAYTSTKPSAPIHLVYVGIVVRSHPTQGVIEVKIQNGYELEELHDVKITSVANNQGIFYNSSTDLWENKSIATVLGYTPQAQLTLTTTGSSGAATLVGATLNIPNYGSALSGYVPYTGATANLNLGTFGITSGGISSNGIAVSQSGGISASSGATTINGDANGIRINPVTASSNFLSFPSSGSRTYTFPNATGTLALTSDLSSYLPLTGGTLTGALNINLGSGTGLNVASDLVIFRASTGFGSPRQITLAAGNGATTYLEAKGYGGNYITDFGIRTYNASGTAFEVFFATSAGDVGIGNTAPAAKLDVNGTGRFVGGLIAGSLSTPSTGGAGSTSWNFYHDQFAAGDFGLFAASTLRILVNASGNVGIGTSSPSNKLTISNNGNAAVAFRINDTNANASFLSLNVSDSDSAIIAGGTSAIPFDIYTGGTQRMRITSGGDVGIGTTSPGAALQVNGGGDSPLRLRHNSAASGRFWKVGPDSSSNFVVYNESNTGCFISWTATSWTGNSDIRLKNIIRGIDNATNSLLTLNPIIFSWKKDETNKENIGLIAQDVEKVFPQLIDVNNEGMLGVRYTELIPVLIASIQELEARIKQLENK
jgi:hypothetical protein